MTNIYKTTLNIIEHDVRRELEAELNRLAQQVAAAGLRIFQGYVPIDTQTLKDSIVSRVHRTKKSYVVEIVIPDKMLTYRNSTIKAAKLAMILEAGRFRKGAGEVLLKRSQSNLYKSAGQPTQDWILQAVQRWEAETDIIMR